jgi:hypothetical protein
VQARLEKAVLSRSLLVLAKIKTGALYPFLVVHSTFARVAAKVVGI